MGKLMASEVYGEGSCEPSSIKFQFQAPFLDRFPIENQSRRSRKLADKSSRSQERGNVELFIGLLQTFKF